MTFGGVRQIHSGPKRHESVPSSTWDRLLCRYTRWAATRPVLVLALAVLLLATCWGLASQLRIKGDFVSLLPTESGTAQRFQAALARKGGGFSTLIVVVESSDADANRRLIDALASELRRLPRELLVSVQTGSQAERQFFERWRWLFASERDLMLVQCELERERERATGGLDLDESCESDVDEELGRLGAVSQASPLLEGTSSAGFSPAAAGLSGLRERLEQQLQRLDRFETGYFRNTAGTRYALVARAPSAGMGDLSADALLERVNEIVSRVEPKRFHPSAQVGFAGDIPNAVSERKSLMADIALVSALALALILAVILGYFRTPLSLVHIGLAAALGCGVAFAVAKLAFGHLNMASGFLGSIIAGNGINIPMMYLARYRELRGQGRELHEALEQAALDCRRGTWLGAIAAAGAYGSLSVTSFRGFSEFGLIGGSGSVACWFAAFGVCPASLALVERWRSARPTPTKPAQQSPRAARLLARLVTARPLGVFGLVLAAAALWLVPIHVYLKNPWEYDFGKLRSATSSHKGAGHFSVKADEIFRTRGSPELLLADDMSQALAVKQALLDRDRQLFGGKLVERVVTVHDYLGGAPEVVARKLALLTAIRSEIERALPRLHDEDLEFARSFRPPEYLRPLTGADMPELLRSRFTEADGRFGTQIYAEIDRKLSRSKGEHLLTIASLLEGVKSPRGEVVPNASRATVFAEMIRSMSRDAPRSIALALLVVVLVVGLATRALLPFVAVLLSLLLAVWLAVGVAAQTELRLNFLNFVALPLTFGIGVEYAINLYERVRTLQGDVTASLESVAGAIAACSLTTLLGYATLLVGDNLALRSFGRYAAYGEAACLLTALLVLPAGLLLWQRLRSAR